MTDAQIALERLTAWVRDYGDQKPKEFVRDITELLIAAKESLFASNPTIDRLQAEKLKSDLAGVSLTNELRSAKEEIEKLSAEVEHLRGVVLRMECCECGFSDVVCAECGAER